MSTKERVEYNAVDRSFAEMRNRLGEDLWQDEGSQEVVVVGPGRARAHKTAEEPEQAYLLAIDYERPGLAESLDELSELCRTAGAEVAGQMTQRRNAPDPASYIGKGKIAELSALLVSTGADLVVVDEELSPTQLRNLSKSLELRVVDRTQLILDIFAQRARTREGKLQVELAQLNYLLPRLAGMWTHLERQRGGIGMRGPGETQIEVDRRHVRRRLKLLEDQIVDVGKHRQHARENRIAVPFPLVAMVGYTNVGKSTLFNRVTRADVYADNLLFATLDPTTRRVTLPAGWDVLLTDTVGFVSHLPHQLVAAFRATLEEVRQADLLLHVVDAAHPHQAAQIEAVHGVLDDLGVGDKPSIIAYSKSDLVRDQYALRSMVSKTPDSVYISGRTGEGVPQLLQVIQDVLGRGLVSTRMLLPYQRGDLVNLCYARGRVGARVDTDQGVLLDADLPFDLASKLQCYRDAIQLDTGHA